MPEQQNVLASLCAELAARVKSAKNAVAAVHLSETRHVSGFVWRPDVVVTSEQTLPKESGFEVRIDGQSVSGQVAGRDPGTNVALLKLEKTVAEHRLVPASVETGALLILIGADGEGRPSARLGLANYVGGEWNTTHGGRIENRVVLDVALGRGEEGGPVLDAAGGFVGMSTRGPRRQVLAIPHVTIDRIAPVLLRDGRIPRGWIGFALQPVAVPDGLRETAGQRSGLMVMSVAENGPARRAGVVPGDIVLAVDGVPARRWGRISAGLGAERLGKEVPLRLIRNGTIVSQSVTIAERPAE